MATLLMATALISLSILLAHAIGIAQEIADQIIRGELPADLATINQLVRHRAAESSTPLIDGATIILIAAWLIGIGDSYRIGRRQARAGRAD